MKILQYFGLFALLHNGANAQTVDMAVLIGGLDSDDNSHYESVDIYTKHLAEDDRKCPETGAEPTLPDFPFGTSRHNAIYIPNSGIYVCGWVGDMAQQSSQCWNYNPEVSGAWTKVNAALEGAENAAIVEGTCVDVNNPNAFWIMGGQNYEKQVLNETVYLDVSESDNEFQPGCKLPLSVYGHCALNVKIPLVDSPTNNDDYWESVIMMGGYEGVDRFRVQSTDKTFAYCRSNDNINETICGPAISDELQSEHGDYGWSEMPSIKSIVYGKKGFGHTYCAQFVDESLCDGVCLIAHGTWNQVAEYFPLERCAKTGQECEGWKDEIDGVKLDIPNFAEHALGGMITLNNVPTLFLPLYNNTGANGWQEKWTEVMQFKNNKWETVEQWDINRGSFVPISVPKDFLCPKDSTRTTTNNPDSAAQGLQGENLWMIFGAYLLSRVFAFLN